ncbi:hypothetical protein Dimus_038482 [Dionaea muscipula]
MPLRSDLERPAASSNSQARRTGLPPGATGPVIRDHQTEGVPDPVDDQFERTANVQMTPDVYARFQEFQNLPAGEWERFQRFSGSAGCGDNCGGEIHATTSTCAESSSSSGAT